MHTMGVFLQLNYMIFSDAVYSLSLCQTVNVKML